MQTNTLDMMPPIGGKSIIRKTGEEVEVLAFNQPDKGGRSNYEKYKADYEYDWVSYIDSNGVEHIKEHLNILFDFKLVINDTLNNMVNWLKIIKCLLLVIVEYLRLLKNLSRMEIMLVML